MANIFSPLTEIPNQPALSHENIENFKKNSEARQDLRNRAIPVNRAHVNGRKVNESLKKQILQLTCDGPEDSPLFSCTF